MKIFGLMGLSFEDPNKGCEALTFTFLKILEEIYSNEDFEIICFRDTNNLGKIPDYFPNIKLSVHIFNIYNIKSWFSAYRKIKTVDAVFDGSYGDGFTGIYGMRRNLIQILRKQIVYWARKPLFLLPQTYGKYKFPLRWWSKRMIKKATLAYARDDTGNLVRGCGVKTTSDMAFFLPFDKHLYTCDARKTKIGINVSSLLWDYKTGKRFNLTVDYQRFYKELIAFLLEKTDFQVHLIPHVIDKHNYDAPENDCRICDELEKIFSGKIIIAPLFDTAIEAKSYIANMDVFMGSRMHSTIAAISSGVVTIPFSYCHKFESLYEKIGYKYLLSATKLSTEEALSLMKCWLSDTASIKANGEKAVAQAKDNIIGFINDLQKTLRAEKLLFYRS